MPVDSSWNTAVVRPEASNSNTFGSSRVKEYRSNGALLSESKCSLIVLIARSITVKVLRPKKSNLTKPIVSTSSLSNCVIVESDCGSKYVGQKSAMDPGAITIPPACFPTFLAIPSSLKAKSMISETSASS